MILGAVGDDDNDEGVIETASGHERPLVPTNFDNVEADPMSKQGVTIQMLTEFMINKMWTAMQTKDEALVEFEV